MATTGTNDLRLCARLDGAQVCARTCWRDELLDDPCPSSTIPPRGRR
jgi:hypothetical protein